MHTDSLSEISWIAFAGTTQVAAGGPAAVVPALVAWLADHPTAQLLVFDAVTSRPVELDLRGDPEAILARLPQTASEPAGTGLDTGSQDPGKGTAARQPGRPRLGVIGREVTLLPRHWAWLASQPGGASVALRKLVEEASRANRGADRQRVARESLFRFMSALAGDEPGFEEATRALFAGDRDRFALILTHWPVDVASHCIELAQTSFSPLGMVSGAPVGDAIDDSSAQASP